MARALLVEEFELFYKVNFQTVIRGYHVYKKRLGCLWYRKTLLQARHK